MTAIGLVYGLIFVSIGIPAIIYGLFRLWLHLTKDEKAPTNDCTGRILKGYTYKR